MRRREHHLRCLSGKIRFQPTGSTQAPSITRIHPFESPLGTWRRQVVSGGLTKRQEFRGQQTADAVDPMIVLARSTAPITVEAGHRIDTTGLEPSTENIAIVGVGLSIVSGTDHTYLSCPVSSGIESMPVGH